MKFRARRGLSLILIVKTVARFMPGTVRPVLTLIKDSPSPFSNSISNHRANGSGNPQGPTSPSLLMSIVTTRPPSGLYRTGTRSTNLKPSGARHKSILHRRIHSMIGSIFREHRFGSHMLRPCSPDPPDRLLGLGSKVFSVDSGGLVQHITA